MLTKQERLNALNNAGINTNKYFTLNVSESIPAGAKIHVVIDENGVAKPVFEKENNDPILNQIITDGYVKNTKLFRRFVMAQMFQHLNYVSYDKKDKGYDACLRRSYGYDYTFKVMLDEAKVLSKLEVKDKECFDERVHFFNKAAILEVMNDYMDKLAAHIDKMPSKNCKGVPYKKIKGENIFCADIDKKVYRPLRTEIWNMKYAKTYADVYKALNKFMKKMIRLPWNTKKNKVWIDTYKGSGAFYTLKNLVMFHNCSINIDNRCLKGKDAVDYLNKMLDTYYGQGWRMFALMKKVINDNGINTKTYIGEIINK